jgi:hypothetical protein
MGRRSPELKRVRRKRQKIKKNQRSQENKDNSVDAEETLTFNSDNFLAPSDFLSDCGGEEEFEESVGIDLDVMEMVYDDSLQDVEEDVGYYSTRQYLVDCRKRLITKVKKYKKENERMKSEIADTYFKHRKEIEQIRSFYKNVSLGLSRSARMVQSSWSSKELCDKLSTAMV